MEEVELVRLETSDRRCLPLRGTRRQSDFAHGCASFTGRALAEGWPNDVSREALVQRVFRLNVADESLRARLRVDMALAKTRRRKFANIQ